MIYTPYADLIQALPYTDVEDDASQSSTIDVEPFLTPKFTSSFRSVKKSVAFDETKNTCHETEYPKHEVSERWYSSYDLQKFRSATGRAAKDLQHAPTMKGDLVSPQEVLHNTYNACLGMLYDDIDILCPIETAQLFHALQDPVFPVGLSSYASVAVRRDVRNRRRQVVSVVLMIQRTVKDQQTDATARYMRMSLESITRPSRLFAHVIAESQAAISL